MPVPTEVQAPHQHWGDREQKLVFIGANLDKDQIYGLLQECLMTNEEVRGGRKQPGGRGGCQDVE